MASSYFCEYCGAVIRSSDRECPACGAPNPSFVPEVAPVRSRSAGVPQTIEELQRFCADRGMPLQRMRFFIGTDERSPRAFGIYRDGSDFVVYKNKSDGSRAVRYRGPDEAFAVKELYDKLREEHAKRAGGTSSGSGTRSAGSRSVTARRKSAFNKLHLIVFLIIAAILAACILLGSAGHRNDGYYRYDGDLYYKYGSSWYVDDGYGDWTESYYFPDSDYGEYYEGRSYDDSWGVSDFEESWYWEDAHSSDSDSDWDYDDYDYDSWDSGDTDWDSDW